MKASEQPLGWDEWREAIVNLFVKDWGFRPDVSEVMSQTKRMREFYERGDSPEVAMKAEIIAQSLEY